MGTFARNRENDFASFANLGGKANLTDSELNYLVDVCQGLCKRDKTEMMPLALLESERLYRISCVLAYGCNPLGIRRGSRERSHKSMIATLTDIEQFAKIEKTKCNEFNEETEEEIDWVVCSYSIVLPFEEKFLDSYPGILCTPLKYHGSLNPLLYEFGNATQEISVDGKNQIFTLHSYNQPINPEYAYEPFRVLAQVIINARIQSNLVGIFDGKPLFETERPIDRLWQTLAELTVAQSPGVCPVCGKIIDRRRGVTGGHPPVACKNHINKFHNELKREIRNSPHYAQKDMAYSDKREAAIRGLRWKEHPELNERPLRFPCFVS